MLRLAILPLALLALSASRNVASAGEPLRDVIDRRVEQQWQKRQLQPAPRSSDAEFLRRVSLDLHGLVPTAEQAREFLDDPANDKRQRLIDRLLEDPRYAVHQADLWDLAYFGRNPPGFGTDKRGGFQDWLRKQFADNVPYDQWARAILKAEGNTVDQGPPMFFVQYKSGPEDATEAVTQKFLGVQLQCARCHDHPFESWTQKDFYGMAAFLARLRVVDVGNKNKVKAYAIGEMNRGDVLFTGPASEQQPGKKGEPIKPQFLGGEPLQEPETPDSVKDPRNFPNGKQPPAPKFSRKDALAEWIASKDNPYFARAAANRVWAQLMGKGIVHPVDNLTGENPASHPELLDELAAELISSGFDLKQLIREIVSSKAYQLAGAGPPEEAMPLWYERARFRPLSAEELLECWVRASGYEQVGTDKPRDGRLEYKAINWSYMRRYFGKPNDGVGNFQGGLQEHLYMNNGQVYSLISTREGGLHHRLANSEAPWEQRVEELYLSVLSRRPAEEETKKFVEFLTGGEDPGAQLREAIWTLMTCSEFRFNH